MKKIVFVKVTNQCNMNCKFCNVNKRKIIQFNKDKIITTLNSLENVENFILFGGEPTLLPVQDLIDIVTSVNGNWSITTNLTNNLNEYIPLFNLMNKGITISLDLIREVTLSQHKQFLSNLNLIKNYPIAFSTVLTPLMTKYFTVEDYCTILNFICELYNISPQILLNYCIVTDDTNFDYENIDNWLCELYNYKNSNNVKWNCTLFEALENGIPYGNFGECNVGYVNPDGTFINGCVHNEYKKPNYDYMPECLTCEYSRICMGSCPMINKFKCNAPKKLYKMILKRGF